MIKLTKVEKETLDIIRDYVTKNKEMPTIREVAGARRCSEPAVFNTFNKLKSKGALVQRVHIASDSEVKVIKQQSKTAVMGVEM